MKRNIGLAETRWLPQPDPLSAWMSGFRFEPRGFGRQRRDPAATCLMRIIGDYELIFNLGGETQVCFGQEPEPVKIHAGQFVLIPPFYPHAIQTPAEDPHDNFWFHFDAGPAHRQLHFLKTVRPFCSRPIPASRPESWLAVYEELDSAYNAGEQGLHVLMEAGLQRILVLLFREIEHMGGMLDTPGGGDISVRAELVRQVTEHVSANLRETIAAQSIAERFHVSVSTLQKAFAAEMGMSMHQYVLLSRVRRAEILMVESAEPLEAIARETGFASAHALGTAFRHCYHTSPRAWRKRLRD